MRDEVGLFLCVMALFLVALGLWLRSALRRRRCSAEVDGLLLDTERFNGNHVRLVVAFEAKGQVIQAREKVGASLRFRERIGQQLTIRYNPDRPEDFYVVDNHIDRQAILLCAGLATLFAILCFAIYGRRALFELQFFFRTLPYRLRRLFR